MSTIAISLAIAAAVAVLATLALGLCRAARRPGPGDWLADVAWTTGPDYQARRARAEEEA